MNAHHIHQIRTATLATVIAFVAYAGTTAPAFATHAHDDGEGGVATTALTPYAEPIEALGGETLAEYLKHHHDGDHRLHTVV